MSAENGSYRVEKPAKVYFMPLSKKEAPNSIAKKTKTLLNKTDFLSVVEPKKLVALKQHFGEKGNEGYVRPEITKVVADLIKSKAGKPLLVETNTLYHGERSNTYNHLMQAYEHGFSIEKLGIPVVVLDGVNGQNQASVKIPGELFQEVHMVSDLPYFDSLFVISHVKGHIASGFGAAIKNLAMGFASRAGKLAQHDNFQPTIDRNICIVCGLCASYCPEHALTIENRSLEFDSEKCIGCGECYSACPSEAISFNWAVGGSQFQKNIAEHAFGAVIKHNKKTVFLNYFNHVTKQCDCWGPDNPVLYGDVGIFASQDAVAVDRASFDMGQKVFGKDIFKEFWPELDPLVQFSHAEKIGMGTQEYKLIEVS